MIRRNVSDHWSFLEEIEAPMWVDLTLEVSNNDQERAEKWFSESHLFHQYSSRQLKSTFSPFSEENGSSDFCLQGPSSPKLPSSVSKSRGKDYRGKKWEQHKSEPSAHQNHLVKVLSATSSSSKQCSYLQSKPKSRTGLRKSRVTRQASRVEITSDMGHRSGHKSSGNSSVGSSSHPLDDAKCSMSSPVEDREVTPNSRRTARTYQALPDKKERMVSGISSTMSNTYKRGKSHLAKPGCQEVAKPKVKHQNCCTKASLPLRFNAPNSFTKEKPKEMLQVSRLNKSVSKEKENLRRKLPECQTSGNTGRFQKGITGNVSQKGDQRVLVGLKLGDVRGNEGKAIKNVSQKGLLSMR